MEAFERSPEAIVIKDTLREFFLGILESIKGAFLGFFEWIGSVRLNIPPMIKIFGNGTTNRILFFVIIAFIIFMNTKTYFLFRYDKNNARDEEERVPEFRLLLNMWLGGGIGGLIAIYKLRHKTKHRKFTVTAKILAVVQMLSYSAILGFMSYWIF